jgi:hypothetical protein
MRFLTLGFFHQSTLFRALIHRLKLFRICLQIRQEIWFEKLPKSASVVSMRPRKLADFICWSSPLTFTFSSNYKYVMFPVCIFVFAIVSLSRNWEPICEFTRASAVSQRILRCHWDRWFRYHSLSGTAVSASVVSFRLQKQNLFRYCFVLKTTFLRKNNVVDTAAAASAVSLRPLKQFHMIISNFSAILKPYAKWL